MLSISLEDAEIPFAAVRGRPCPARDKKCPTYWDTKGGHCEGEEKKSCSWVRGTLSHWFFLTMQKGLSLGWCWCGRPMLAVGSKPGFGLLHWASHVPLHFCHFGVVTFVTKKQKCYVPVGNSTAQPGFCCCKKRATGSPCRAALLPRSWLSSYSWQQLLAQAALGICSPGHVGTTEAMITARVWLGHSKRWYVPKGRALRARLSWLSGCASGSTGWCSRNATARVPGKPGSPSVKHPKFHSASTSWAPQPFLHIAWGWGSAQEGSKPKLVLLWALLALLRRNIQILVSIPASSFFLWEEAALVQHWLLVPSFEHGCGMAFPYQLGFEKGTVPRHLPL